MSNNWFTKSASTDISFCSSDCQNTECDRCTQSKLFEMASDYNYYSCCDFSNDCKSYIAPKEEGK